MMQIDVSSLKINQQMSVSVQQGQKIRYTDCATIDMTSIRDKTIAYMREDKLLGPNLMFAKNANS